MGRQVIFFDFSFIPRGPLPLGLLVLFAESKFALACSFIPRVPLLLGLLVLFAGSKFALVCFFIPMWAPPPFDVGFEFHYQANLLCHFLPRKVTC